MNNSIDDSFYEYADREFDAYLSDIIYALNSSSEEYRKA